MVGICSRISAGWRHRRAQNAVDLGETVSPNVQLEGVCSPNTGMAINDQAVEFRPVEPPMEPVISDVPVACPLPEPSILEDGTIMKEKRTSASQPRTDLPVLKVGIDVRTRKCENKKHQSCSSEIGSSALASSSGAPEQNTVTFHEEGKSLGSQMTE